MGRLSWIIWVVPSSKPQCPWKRGRGRLDTQAREGDVTPEADWSEANRKGRSPSYHQRLQKATDSPLKPLEGAQPCPHLWPHETDVDLLASRAARVTFCCFKLLSLWSSVMGSHRKLVRIKFMITPPHPHIIPCKSASLSHLSKGHPCACDG